MTKLSGSLLKTRLRNILTDCCTEWFLWNTWDVRWEDVFPLPFDVAENSCVDNISRQEMADEENRRLVPHPVDEPQLDDGRQGRPVRAEERDRRKRRRQS